MTLTQYLERIATEYKSGRATEHSYRSHLKDLVEQNLPGVNAINVPNHNNMPLNNVKDVNTICF